VLAQKGSLRRPADAQALIIQLMLEGIGFLGRQHAHELEFYAKMVMPLVSVLSNPKLKGAVKRGEISELMGLKKGIRFQVTILNFVQRTAAARGVPKGSEVLCEESLIVLNLQT
jgi:hypothetical protein